MKKYKFNHGEKPHSTFGISQERYSHLCDAAVNTAISAVITDPEITCSTKALEVLMNEVKPKDTVEAMLIGFLFAKIEAIVVKAGEDFIAEKK